MRCQSCTRVLPRLRRSFELKLRFLRWPKFCLPCIRRASWRVMIATPQAIASASFTERTQCEQGGRLGRGAKARALRRPAPRRQLAAASPSAMLNFTPSTIASRRSSFGPFSAPSARGICRRSTILSSCGLLRFTRTPAARSSPPCSGQADGRFSRLCTPLPRLDAHNHLPGQCFDELLGETPVGALLAPYRQVAGEHRGNRGLADARILIGTSQ